jgi:Tfp pilus assembly protein PilW
MRRARREDGFSVVELLVTTIVLGVVFAAFSLVLTSTVHHGSDVRERALLQAEARGAIDRLASELRQAYTGSSSAPVETASPTQITFLSPDRAQPFHLRRISYRLNGGMFERAVATSTDTDGAPWNIPALGGWETLARSVNTVAFTYRDGAGASTSTASAVRSVDVVLALSAPTSQGRQYTYRTTVTLRASG